MTTKIEAPKCPAELVVPQDTSPKPHSQRMSDTIEIECGLEQFKLLCKQLGENCTTLKDRLDNLEHHYADLKQHCEELEDERDASADAFMRGAQAIKKLTDERAELKAKIEALELCVSLKAATIDE